MTGKTQSILLQVAFKEAAQARGTVAEIEARTIQFFEVLTSLHEKFNINPDEGRSGISGSGARPQVTGPEFLYNGVTFIDYTAAKETGQVKAKFPDFRTKDGSEMPGITNKTGAVWTVSQEGDAKPELEGLVAAAKAAATL